MPRNKRTQPSAQKRAEIILAARHLFVEQGFEATAMSKLATSAGIAANTIYWYFQDKDELLVAVLDAELAQGLLAYQQQSFGSVAERLAWVVAQFGRVRLLVGTVHQRLHESAVLAEWHSRFHRMAGLLIDQQFQLTARPAAEREAIRHVVVFAVEGLLSHTLSPAEQQAVCQVLARLASAPTPA